MGSKVAPSEFVTLLGQHDDGAPFRSFIRERGKLGGIGQVGLFDSRRGEELGSGTVSQGDRSSLVEEQHVHVARGFHGAPGHGDDVPLNHAIHPGNADRGQETSDGRGNQANQK